MATLIRCNLAVECNGRALHAEKGAKMTGVEVADAGSSSPFIRVLGMKRDIRLAAQEVLQISDSKVSEGRLGFAAKGGLRVIMLKAQPAQLQFLLSRLRGGTTGGGIGLSGGLPGHKAPPSQLQLGGLAPKGHPIHSPAPRHAFCPSMAAVLQQTAAPCRAVRACQSAPVDAVRQLSMAALDSEALKQILGFSMDRSFLLARFSESCVSLGSFCHELHTKLHINTSCTSISPSSVIRLLEKRRGVKDLRLAGWSQLTPGETGAFARVFLECTLDAAPLAPIALRRLSLRGCNKLSDASVKRLLDACPHLEILDLLDIPRLSNAALAVPLKSLRVLAVGSLGRRETADGPRTGEKIPVGLTCLGAQAAVGGGLVVKRPICSVNFTSALLTRLSQGVGDGASAPLEHLVLANCSDIEVLPRLPRSLKHLDMRGANLQLPIAAVAGWRPLASLAQLEVLCLAGNTLLSSEALLACITSLRPSSLRVLDLSETRIDMHMWQHLTSAQQMITHLRLAGCTSLGMIAAVQLEPMFRGMTRLEVLDIASCYLDEIDLLPRSRPLPAVAATPAAAPPEASSGGARQPQSFLRAIAPATVWGAQAAAPIREEVNSLAPSLRLLGVGQMGGQKLESIRRALVQIAPGARAVGGSLDIFGAYKELPPVLQ